MVALQVDGRWVVYLIYVDDAGSAPDQDLQITAGITVFDKQWLSVQAAVEQIAADFAPAGQHASFELHASDLFQGHRYFKGWERSVRTEILNRVLKIITDFKLTIIYGGVNKPNLRAKYVYPADPNDLSFLLLAERVERWFASQAADEVGMFIADETKAKVQMKKSLRVYRKSGIPLGIRDERLEHIVDTIHFADSRESCGIQLADFCAYFIKRFLTGRNDVKAIYEELCPLIHDSKVFP